MSLFVFREIRTGQAHEYFPAFDWLRFVLASAVALTHEGLIPWENGANLAVQVFFALSGWLIGGILLKSDAKALPRFYFNRGTRIWIPYALAVAVIYGVAAAHEGVNARFFECLFYDGTFTHNWFIHPPAPMPLHGTGAHFWSIAVEEQFYLAAPLMIVLLPVGRSVLFWALVAATACLTRSWYGAISLGVLAAVAREHYGDWQLGRLWFAVLAGAVFITATILALLPGFYLYLAPLLAVAIVLLASAPGRKNGIGRFLGGMSYPLYLYHWAGMFAANIIGRRISIPVGLTAYAVALVVGSAAYIAVDRNVMKWRGQFYSQKRGKAFMATAYSLLAAGIAGGFVLA